MASSSLSQESLDHELNLLTRRNKVKVATRSRCTFSKHESISIETTDDHELADLKVEELIVGEHVLGMSPGSLFFDHESPNRTVKFKDKRWPSHLHKNKPILKDKRKLREKRRSFGVVHVQSTESSADSLDESEAVPVNRDNSYAATNSTVDASGGGKNESSYQKLVSGTHNEIIDADNPQTPEEDRKMFGGRTVRSKSPSDLDADLEDNQDYDSTVSQPDVGCSRTNSSTRFPTLQLFPASSASNITMTNHYTNTSNVMSTASLKDDCQASFYHNNACQVSNSSDNKITSQAIDDCLNKTFNDCSTTMEDCSMSHVADRTTVEEMLLEEREKNKKLQGLLSAKEKLISELEQKIVSLTGVGQLIPNN